MEGVLLTSLLGGRLGAAVLGRRMGTVELYDSVTDCLSITILERGLEPCWDRGRRENLRIHEPFEDREFRRLSAWLPEVTCVSFPRLLFFVEERRLGN